MNDRDKVQFLRQFQELLAEGGFVATYKFALLQALADLSVEGDPKPDGSLRVPVEGIAEKFIEYYWNQARPFRDSVLRQNTKGQAEVVTLVREHRNRVGGRLARLQGGGRDWQQLKRRVANVVVKMPLWRLQRIGNTDNEFLYRRSEYRDRTIRLLPGVPLAFRAFHPLLTGLIRGAWLNQIHRIRANREVLGPRAELEEFLFGIDRASLEQYRELLRDHQESECFYCGKKVKVRGELDHFVPWSRYPIDLGHNFVYAHRGCNNAKRDHLAAIDHLERWRLRNLDEGRALARQFQGAELGHDLNRTRLIAQWAYQQGQANGAQLWIRDGEFEPCDYRWQLVLGGPGSLRLAAEEPPHYT